MTDKKPRFTIRRTEDCDLCPENFQEAWIEAIGNPKCPFCEMPLDILIEIGRDSFTVVKDCDECPQRFVEDYVNADSNTDHRYDD